MTTKADKIKQYNLDNKGYNITNIKKMTEEQLAYYKNGNTELRDIYDRYSEAKRESFDWIKRTYKPTVLGMVGSSHAYSVVLVADNGDTLWITRDNNYLVEVV